MNDQSPVRPRQKSEGYPARMLARLQAWNDARRAARHDDSIFIWIPKNAGTSVYTMLHANGLVKLNTPSAVKLFRNSGRVTFGHMSICSLIGTGDVSREFVDGAFKFALTRDPYARAVSIYRVYCRKRMANWHHKPSFREFLQLIADGYYDRIGLYNSSHFTACNPQVEWLRGAWPDKLYRMENLDEFVTDISKRWGISQPDVVHANRTTNEVQLELGPEEKALIEHIYAEDFEAFGYPKR
jgi:hypothetical protein